MPAHATRTVSGRHSAPIPSPNTSYMAKRNADAPAAPDSGAAPDAQANPLPATYEAALQELESLVSRLDAGQLPLEDLLRQYQRGTELLRFCQGKLEAVEQQIQVFENGEGRPWAGGA